MNEEAIEQVLWFMDLPEMRVDGRYSNLRERAYRLWAASEILRFLMDHPTMPADRAIDELHFLMLGYIYTAPTETCRFIFQIAFETIEAIHDMFWKGR